MIHKRIVIMKSLNKAFMEVYGEALARYGFRKVKSRQPYIIRLINDEIVQVITVIREDTADYETNGFRIYAGIATVYRLMLDFDEKPYNCRNWLISIDSIYRDGDFFGDREDRFIGKYRCVYSKNDEKELMNCMKNSVEGTKEIALRIFEEIDTLKMCIKFWEYYSISVYTVHINMLLKPKDYGEGQVSLLVFDTCDEYNEHMHRGVKERDQRNINAIKKGLIGGTVEEYMDKINGKRRQEVIEWKKEGFSYYRMNKENYRKAMDELKKRKVNNLKYISDVLL